MNNCIEPGCVKPAFCRGVCAMHYSRLMRWGSTKTTQKCGNGETLEWTLAHKDHAGDDCLIWPYARKSDGYGKASYNGRSLAASRLMCIVAHGDPPADALDAAHSCGNGPAGCVNPRHLRWATRSENMQDAVAHGTAPRGERQGGSKLTNDKVRQIRIALAAGGSLTEIAADFGVVFQTISQIKNGKTWRWLA